MLESSPHSYSYRTESHHTTTITTQLMSPHTHCNDHHTANVTIQAPSHSYNKEACSYDTIQPYSTWSLYSFIHHSYTYCTYIHNIQQHSTCLQYSHYVYMLVSGKCVATSVIENNNKKNNASIVTNSQNVTIKSLNIPRI